MPVQPSLPNPMYLYIGLGVSQSFNEVFEEYIDQYVKKVVEHYIDRVANITEGFVSTPVGVYTNSACPYGTIYFGIEPEVIDNTEIGLQGKILVPFEGKQMDSIRW